MLFVIGGNGSHAGANAIHEEVATHSSFHTSRKFSGMFVVFTFSFIHFSLVAKSIYDLISLPWYFLQY